MRSIVTLTVSFFTLQAFDHGVVVKFLSYKGSIQKMHLLQRPRDLTADEQVA